MEYARTSHPAVVSCCPDHKSLLPGPRYSKAEKNRLATSPRWAACGWRTTGDVPAILRTRTCKISDFVRQRVWECKPDHRSRNRTCCFEIASWVFPMH